MKAQKGDDSIVMSVMATASHIDRSRVHSPGRDANPGSRTPPGGFTKSFVEMLPESSPIRMAFDGRNMEIMVKGPVHDHFSQLLDMFVISVAGELGIRIKPMRETTWIRPEIARGIEADNCYYLDPRRSRSALAALGRQSNDVKDYPNPDLAIEVDISPPEADRAVESTPRCASRRSGVFDGQTLTIHRLGREWPVPDR